MLLFSSKPATQGELAEGQEKVAWAMCVGFDTREENSFAYRNFFLHRICPDTVRQIPLIWMKRSFIQIKLLGGQLCAALRAAARQHLAAVGRAHTLAEAMLLGALTLLRLIRSLHSSCTSLFSGFTDGHRHRSGARPRAHAAACPHNMRQYLLSYKKPELSSFF